MTDGTRRIALALTASAVLALAAGSARAQDAPFAGERDIAPGDIVNGTLAGTAGEVNLFYFFGTERSVLNVSLAPAAGSTVVPRLRLVRPGGEAVDLGKKLKVKGSKSSIAGFRLPYGGLFALEVTAESGNGAYVLKTSAKPTGSSKGVDAGAAGANEVEFRTLAGATATITLAPRGKSAARPVITGLVAPDGTSVAVTPVAKGKASIVKGVVLDQAGAWRIVWNNTGAEGEISSAVAFKNPKPAKNQVNPGVAQGIPQALVDMQNTGVAGGQPLPGYAGSAVCGKCHDELFKGWAGTVHNLAVRDWRRAGLTGKSFVNDADGNGQDDFRDGLDLATVPAFATYGALAPKLSFEAGAALPYKITIGAVKYDVIRTMGGNGQWKQRYLVLVGNHMYPSPVQYNDGPLAPAGTAKYAVYDGSDWYTGTAPNWAAKYADPNAIPKEKSFENRCSGCHNTGETITRDVATGNYVVAYKDFNIGCEQCHGPSEAHANDPLAVKPVNPRDFFDGTAAGVRKANEVCGKCHTRGAAKDFFPGLTGSKAGFPYSQAAGVPHVGPNGIDIVSTFDITTSAGDFWGRKADPFDASKSLWVASKSHRQQALDMQMGRHDSDQGYSSACFDCHDPHFRRQRFQVRKTITETEPGAGKGRAAGDRVVVETKAGDNSLCLSCHAGHGPYAGLTKADVAGIASGTVPQAVRDAVVYHMKDIGMPVASGAYDPEGTHVGQCISCHMPMLEKTAISRLDPAGLRLNDEHNHTFYTINPRVSQLYKDGTVGMSNSCSVCHPTSGNDAVDDIIAQWWADDADADGTFHADTPRSFQNGIANPNRNGGVYCVQCHTTAGFVEVQVKGGAMDAATADRLIRDSVGRDKGIACDACHGSKGDGTFGTEANPLRFPKAELCQKCHNAQTVVFADFQTYGEMVRHPQKEMYESASGAESPGATYGTGNPHRGGAFANACQSCHFEKSVAGASHTFDAQVASCTPCHGEVTASFDRPGIAGRDWDGDSTVEGFQTEVTGLLDKLKAAILAADVNVTFSAGGYYEFGAATDHKLTGASDAVKRAAYNWYSVHFDASRGIHNPIRAVQLLQKSYKELTGLDASTNLK